MPRKLVSAPILLVLACLFAGAYGAIHNQVSYTVSPEYFTQFKFYQFHVSEEVPARLGAAFVGFLASWWMGLLIGIVLIPAGSGIQDRRAYFFTILRAYAAVTMTAIVVGLVALGGAYALLDAQSVGQITPNRREVHDDLAFARAGTMHNFSYLGGVLALFSGGWVIVRGYRSQSAGGSGIAK